MSPSLTFSISSLLVAPPSFYLAHKHISLCLPPSLSLSISSSRHFRSLPLRSLQRAPPPRAQCQKTEKKGTCSDLRRLTAMRSPRSRSSRPCCRVAPCAILSTRAIIELCRNGTNSCYPKNVTWSYSPGRPRAPKPSFPRHPRQYAFSPKINFPRLSSKLNSRISNVIQTNVNMNDVPLAKNIASTREENTIINRDYSSFIFAFTFIEMGRVNL